MFKNDAVTPDCIYAKDGISEAFSIGLSVSLLRKPMDSS